MDRDVIKALVEALEKIEWGYDHGAGSVMESSYCRACDGFQDTERTHRVNSWDRYVGTIEYTHAEDCIVAKALVAGREALGEQG